MKRTTITAAIFLSLLTLACYWPATRNGFVVLDDPKYIYENAHVQSGLTWSGIAWAFTSGYACNWHPVTWITHMLDCQLYGVNPGGHHFTSILLHAINGLLLFLLLQRMTRTFWRSLLVAALFAWHPLHVESVAWVAERKDVLSTLFFLLTLHAYLRYVKCKLESTDTVGTSRFSSNSFSSYWLAVVFFGFGLMSKPMLVTLPCVLLLLDFWPLKRLSVSGGWAHAPAHSGQWKALVLEKLPFFAMSLGASLVTFFVQRAGGAVSSLGTVSFGDRFANVAVAYVRYLSKIVSPVDLSVFYPLPLQWPITTVSFCLLLILVLSALFVRGTGRYPYLTMGWLWFLGTLVPTIGIVQVGSQSMADRYTYIPSIGLFIMVAWGLADLALAYTRLKWFFRCTATASLAACLGLTFVQVGYWHDEEKLFRHAMACVPDNYLAFDHLAKVCEADGRKAEALAFYEALLELKPTYPEGNYNCGTLLLGMGKAAQAEPRFRKMIAYRPDYAPAHSNLGISLFRQNKLDEALQHLQTANQLDATDPDVPLNLGITLLALNKPSEAATCFSSVLRLKPKAVDAQFLLALALSRDQKSSQAAVEAQKAQAMAMATGRQEIAAQAEQLLKSCQANSPQGQL